MQICGGNQHGLFGNGARVETGVPRERLCRRHRIRASRSDRHDPIVGLDEIAVPRQEIGCVRVHDDQHRFEPPEHPIGAPVLRELDRGSLEVTAILFELGFEARKERKRIGGRSGKPRENPVVVEAANLPRALFDDGVAEGDLPVAGHYGMIAVAHGQHCCRVKHHQEGRNDDLVRSLSNPPTSGGRDPERASPGRPMQASTPKRLPRGHGLGWGADARTGRNALLRVQAVPWRPQ